MRSLIISIFLLFVLVVTPKHVFAEPLPGNPHIEVADVFYAPMFNDTGFFGAFGGYLGGDSVDWSIGNTIPYSDSMTDDIVFSTSLGDFMNPANWKERMRITKDGNVSIGTEIPEAKLHVGGTAGVDGIMFPDGTLQTTATLIGLQGPQGDPGDSHWLLNGNDTYYNIGNVGIGTNSPQVMLHVNGDIKGSNISTDIYNTFLGNGVGNFNITGIQNTFIGNESGTSNTTGHSNTFIGNGVGNSNITGVQNTFIGEGAGYHTTGSGNVFLGFRAGYNEHGSNKLYIANSEAGNPLIYGNFSEDKVGIGTTSPNYTLDVRGDIGNNTTLYHSDIRWKKNVSSVTDALDKVTGLRGVNFEWREVEFPEMAFSEGAKLGFIAQEVEEILPEVVHTGSDGYKSVQYANIVPLLVEAIKELKEEVEALKQVKVENMVLKQELKTKDLALKLELKDIRK